MQKVGKWAVGGASLVSLMGACGDDARRSVRVGTDGSVVTDGGVRDGGAVDGGVRDGGAVDGGVRDGGAVDGGAVDGGVRDGGAVDGGVRDGGAVDGGAVDSGRTDSGASAEDRALLEQAIRDACDLFFVSCYPDDYTREDCIDYHTPDMDAALGIPGCPTELVNYFDCLAVLASMAGSTRCRSSGCRFERTAATAACPDIGFL